MIGIDATVLDARMRDALPAFATDPTCRAP
jgi:hypothetical protein